MRNGLPLVSQLTANGPEDHLFSNSFLHKSHSSSRSSFLRITLRAAARTHRLLTLRVIAVDSNGLQAQPPALNVGLHDVVNTALFGHVDGLGDGTRNVRLYSSHHLQVAVVVDGARAIHRPEAAIKHGQVLRLEPRRAFNRPRGVNVADDGLHLLWRIAQLDESLRDRVVDDLDNPAAHQLLVLHQCEIGLDPRRVAVHHEPNRARGRNHGHLAVAIPVDTSKLKGFFPRLLGVREHVRRNIAVVDQVHRIAVHTDDFKERLNVLRVAREGACGPGNASRGEVRLAAHHRGDGTRSIATAIAVIGHAHRHEQGTKIREAETERAVIVRVLRNLLRGIGCVVHQNFLGDDERIHSVPEGNGIEDATGARELQQVQ